MIARIMIDDEEEKSIVERLLSPRNRRCQARLCRNFGGRHEWREGKGLDLGCGPRACPAGATELSPGFQPWEPSKLTDEARTLLPRQRQSAQLERAAIGLLDLASAFLGPSIWRPFIRVRRFGWSVPRVKTPVKTLG